MCGPRCSLLWLPAPPQLSGKLPADLTRDQLVSKYIKSIGVGILKVRGWPDG